MRTGVDPRHDVAAHFALGVGGGNIRAFVAARVLFEAVLLDACLELGDDRGVRRRKVAALVRVCREVEEVGAVPLQVVLTRGPADEVEASSSMSGTHEALASYRMSFQSPERSAACV